MVVWHHWLDGHEFEWTQGDGDGQGGLVCCDSWGRKESDTTERLNWTEAASIFLVLRGYKQQCSDLIYRFVQHPEIQPQPGDSKSFKALWCFPTIFLFTMILSSLFTNVCLTLSSLMDRVCMVEKTRAKEKLKRLSVNITPFHFLPCGTTGIFITCVYIKFKILKTN